MSNASMNEGTITPAAAGATWASALIIVAICCCCCMRKAGVLGTSPMPTRTAASRVEFTITRFCGSHWFSTTTRLDCPRPIVTGRFSWLWSSMIRSSRFSNTSRRLCR